MTKQDARFDDIERRLERLERLAFIGFQETREVAEYAFQQVGEDPEYVKRISWKQSNFHPLDDQEIVNVAGLATQELASLKMAMRLLRRQSRMDALGIIRDLARRGRKESLKEAA